MNLLDRVFPPGQCDDSLRVGFGVGGLPSGRRGDEGQSYTGGWRTLTDDELRSVDGHWADRFGNSVVFLISEYDTWGPGADDEVRPPKKRLPPQPPFTGIRAEGGRVELPAPEEAPE